MIHHHIKVFSVLSIGYSWGKWQKSMKAYKRGSQQKKDNINSPGAAGQRRVWELIGRRKTAASALWHFFQRQEHQLCQLQNGQLAHPGPLVNFISEPAGQDVNRGWQFYLLPCASLISFLFHLYTLTIVSFIGGLQLEKQWDVPTHPPCLPITTRSRYICVWANATLPQ